LRFWGYFKQTVHESPNEFYRVRPVTILYYLEDDSMQIFEDPVENSGIPQVRKLKYELLSHLITIYYREN
jgi:EF-hand domain-containing protein 1